MDELEFAHLKIQLKEIKVATGNFGNNVIGIGGFGKVYRGIVSHSKGRSMVAIKRLDRRYGQGDCEFRKELSMLSRYTHKNLISILGFCDEDDEKIIVYEYACNASLDRHLSSPSLTWTQRIKICLGAANGLRYLHDPKGTQQRVLHRDIKSSNILLDANWNAKVSDMGLAKLAPANQQHTVVYTHIVGTPGYFDPQYMINGKLTKESDIYSFGVVLFEVLCGELCFKFNKDTGLEILVPTWKQKYKHNNLQDIVFQDLRPSMNSTSLKIFSNIAFECLHDSREQRPTFSQVVEKLERALEFQELHDKKDERVNQTSTTRKAPFSETDQNYLAKEKPKINIVEKKHYELPNQPNVDIFGEFRKHYGLSPLSPTSMMKHHEFASPPKMKHYEFPTLPKNIFGDNRYELPTPSKMNVFGEEHKLKQDFLNKKNESQILMADGKKFESKMTNLNKEQSKMDYDKKKHESEMAKLNKEQSKMDYDKKKMDYDKKKHESEMAKLNKEQSKLANLGKFGSKMDYDKKKHESEMAKLKKHKSKMDYDKKKHESEMAKRKKHESKMAYLREKH